MFGAVVNILISLSAIQPSILPHQALLSLALLVVSHNLQAILVVHVVVHRDFVRGYGQRCRPVQDHLYHHWWSSNL